MPICILCLGTVGRAACGAASRQPGSCPEACVSLPISEPSWIRRPIPSRRGLSIIFFSSVSCRHEGGAWEPSLAESASDVRARGGMSGLAVAQEVAMEQSASKPSWKGSGRSATSQPRAGWKRKRRRGGRDGLRPGSSWAAIRPRCGPVADAVASFSSSLTPGSLAACFSYHIPVGEAGQTCRRRVTCWHCANMQICSVPTHTHTVGPPRERALGVDFPKDQPASHASNTLTAHLGLNCRRGCLSWRHAVSVSTVLTPNESPPPFSTVHQPAAAACREVAPSRRASRQLVVTTREIQEPEAGWSPCTLPPPPANTHMALLRRQPVD